MLDQLRNSKAFLALAALLVVLAVAGCGGGSDHQPNAVTIKVDGADPDRQRDDSLTVPTRPIAEAKDSSELGHGQNLHGESPPGVPNAVLEDAQQRADELAATDQLPIVTPDAAPQQRGCASRFVRNYSSRRGVRPRWIVVHETVSPNLPGVQDLLGLTARANDPAAAVSWTYNIDRDGNCFYTVRESDKPWTQAAANPFSIGIEVVNTTREFPFMKPAGYRKLGLVISDAARRWRIPLALGSVNGCAPGRAGIISHAMLGPCGGGHVDIGSHDGPANGGHPELRRIVQFAKLARCSTVCRLRRDHARTHKAIRDRRCAPEPRSKSVRCRALYARNHADHARARKLKAQL